MYLYSTGHGSHFVNFLNCDDSISIISRGIFRMVFVVFMSLISLLLDVSNRELEDLLILERSIYVLFA